MERGSMMDTESVKTLGICVGILLFAYAIALAKLDRYAKVSDKYASAFSTVGLAVVLVASGGFTRPPINLLAEVAGYLALAAAGTFAIWRIDNHQQRYQRA